MSNFGKVMQRATRLKSLVAMALVLSSAGSFLTTTMAQAQSIPIGLGLGLGMGLLSHAHRHSSSSSYGGGYGDSGSSGQRRTKSAAIGVYNKGVKAFNAENYDDSIQLLSQALAIDPHMGNAYALMGVCKAKTGHYMDAMQDFTVAQNYGFHYQSMLYEEGMCAARLGDYRTARDCFQKYLASGHSQTQNDAAQKGLAIIDHNFVNQSNDDYLTDASKEGVRRWRDPSQPIRVFIQENPNLKGYRPEFAGLVKQSFDDWARGTNDKVSFVFTADPAEAQIKCSWTDNQAELGDTKELGVTMLTFADGVIETANIKLFTLTGFCRDDASEVLPQAKCVALHEIGHALGLQHSEQPFDTMYPLVPPKGLEFPLTRRDVNTVTALYSKGQTQYTSMDNTNDGTNVVSQAQRK